MKKHHPDAETVKCKGLHELYKRHVPVCTLKLKQLHPIPHNTLHPRTEPECLCSNGSYIDTLLNNSSLAWWHGYHTCLADGHKHKVNYEWCHAIFLFLMNYYCKIRLWVTEQKKTHEWYIHIISIHMQHLRANWSYA